MARFMAEAKDKVEFELFMDCIILNYSKLYNLVNSEEEAPNRQGILDLIMGTGHNELVNIRQTYERLYATNKSVLQCVSGDTRC